MTFYLGWFPAAILTGCIILSTAKAQAQIPQSQMPVLKILRYIPDNLLEPITLVACNMADGSVSQCAKIKVKSTPFEDGPYCPEHIDDPAGIYLYDGKTNPGLRAINRSLFQDMENDGYDIVDDNGKVHTTIADLSLPPPELDPTKAYCIDAPVDRQLTLTYFIPAYPKWAKEPADMDNASKIVGLSLFGVPINGAPPSVSEPIPGPTGPGSFPALDPCGGHRNENFYHSHVFSETINATYSRKNINDVSCDNIPQLPDVGLIGYAMDGYPIYAKNEFFGIQPAGLDQCNGHMSRTIDYPKGVYHYHADAQNELNIPKCLNGKLAEQQLKVE
jgi:hypothetical protein